jgi:hypothetical protein
VDERKVLYRKRTSKEVLSFVQTNEENFSCSFREFSSSRAKTSRKNRETNKALVMTLFGKKK